jgi:hypothetical protein
MAPVPHRGKACHCGYITHIADKIAELKQIDVETVYETTRKNTFNLFGIYIYCSLFTFPVLLNNSSFFFNSS